MKQIVLITGCSSGMGLVTSIYLAEKNYKVYASMRDLNKKEQLMTASKKAGVDIKLLQLDVTDEESVKSAVGSILEKEGRIDILVNNAGYGSGGFLEEFSMPEIKEQFETNFYGLIRVTQEVLPAMRKQQRGHIVNISSIGGKIAFPVLSIYNASKFAVEALTESLRIELVPFNIKATTITPTGVKSNFNKSVKAAKRSEEPSSPYHQYFEQFKKNIDKMANQSVSPTVVAEAVHKAITTKNPKRSYPVGKGAKMFMALKGLLPNRTFENIMYKQFFG